MMKIANQMKIWVALFTVAVRSKPVEVGILSILLVAVFSFFAFAPLHNKVTKTAYVFADNGYLFELEIQQGRSVRWKQRKLSDGTVQQDGKETGVNYLGVSNQHLVFQKKNDIIARSLASPEHRIAMNIGQLEPSLSHGFEVTTVTHSHITLRAHSGARFNVMTGERVEPANPHRGRGQASPTERDITGHRVVNDGKFQPDRIGDLRSSPWTGTPLQISFDHPKVILNSVDGATVGVDEQTLVFASNTSKSEFPKDSLALIKADGTAVWLKDSTDLIRNLRLKQDHSTLSLRAGYVDNTAVHLVLEHTKYRRVDQYFRASENSVFYVALNRWSGGMLKSVLIDARTRLKSTG